jgi:hypothetical protein
MICTLLAQTAPPSMTTYEWAQLWVNIAVAVGTIAVVIVAIWGNWIQATFFGPKITIEPHKSLEPEPFDRADNRTAIFYFLRVSNARRWVAARGVRVV